MISADRTKSQMHRSLYSEHLHLIKIWPLPCGDSRWWKELKAGGIYADSDPRLLFFS